MEQSVAVLVTDAEDETVFRFAATHGSRAFREEKVSEERLVAVVPEGARFPIACFAKAMFRSNRPPPPPPYAADSPAPVAGAANRLESPQLLSQYQPRLDSLRDRFSSDKKATLSWLKDYMAVLHPQSSERGEILLQLSERKLLKELDREEYGQVVRLLVRHAAAHCFTGDKKRGGISLPPNLRDLSKREKIDLVSMTVRLKIMRNLLAGLPRSDYELAKAGNHLGDLLYFNMEALVEQGASRFELNTLYGELDRLVDKAYHAYADSDCLRMLVNVRASVKQIIEAVGAPPPGDNSGRHRLQQQVMQRRQSHAGPPGQVQQGEPPPAYVPVVEQAGEAPSTSPVADVAVQATQEPPAYSELPGAARAGAPAAAETEGTAPPLASPRAPLSLQAPGETGAAVSTRPTQAIRRRAEQTVTPTRTQASFNPRSQLQAGARAGETPRPRNREDANRFTAQPGPTTGNARRATRHAPVARQSNNDRTLQGVLAHSRVPREVPAGSRSAPDSSRSLGNAGARRERASTAQPNAQAPAAQNPTPPVGANAGVQNPDEERFDWMEGNNAAITEILRNQ